jgi:predicted nuclease with RNAse H fold
VYAGIDVGASRLHCVVLDAAGRPSAMVCAADDLSRLADAVALAVVVAVDAPAQPSTEPHPEIPGKFGRARCAEIALGREHGIWVPFVAPAARPAAPWMETGFAVFEALTRPDGPRVVEVYPYGGFRVLAGGARLPKKTSPAGASRRGELLQAAGVAAEGLDRRSHDSLDAAMAAVVARDVAAGAAVRVTCGHDDSAIWLPRRAPAG